ncbi:type II secretion system minor pseudopilin GspK [Henriciella aquimarina]|uniref:type II secretion system minor pseudopilin GspK n=1 Tax=Henriciella aquimarina TaxID=545261 RepID=UPI000A0452F6|nr:type II secretion system minor pseudopilin GspK [Henriciella aquimarina]
MRPGERTDEAGVALVTVLMIVAAMSAVGVLLSSAVLASTERAKTLDAATQAGWFVAGSAEFGERLVGDLVGATEGRLHAGMPRLEEPLEFPIEAGMITLRGHDASNCFNVNALGAPTPAGRTGTDALQDYAELVRLADIDGIDERAVAATLSDWIDADQSPELGGAEDSFYRSEKPAYRTSGQPLQNLSELRAVRGYSPSVLAALEPLVCAMPSRVPQVININTLTEAQAPLLSLAMSGALRVEAARDVIFQRPPGGWESLEVFAAEPAIAEIAPDLRRMDMLSVASSHIGVDAAIEYRGIRRSVALLYAIEANGRARLLRLERRG